MSTGTIISLAVNILVGIYFAWFYPRSLRRKLGGGQLPPAFAILSHLLPPLGWLLIIGSVGYAVLRLGGVI